MLLSDEVLWFHDEPLILLCHNNFSHKYLGQLLNFDSGEWMFVSISEPKIIKIKSNEITLCDAFKNPEDDIAWRLRPLQDVDTYEALCINAEDISDDDLPAQGLFLNYKGSIGILPSIDNLHFITTDLTERALIFRQQENDDKAKELFIEAFNLEKRAALSFPPQLESEPSRSDLFYDAASLAFEAKEYEAADWLVANGLAGHPSPEMRKKLKDLYDEIKFTEHLSVKEVELAPKQFLVAIDGKAVSNGVTPLELFVNRIENISRMVYRTVERLMHEPYRSRGSINKLLRGFYTLYARAQAPGSYMITLQMGKPIKQDRKSVV